MPLQTEEGGNSKILKLDPIGMHVRLYGNWFAEYPSEFDESTLCTAAINRKPGESPGMGHAPISQQSFSSWGALHQDRSGGARRT